MRGKLKQSKLLSIRLLAFLTVFVISYTTCAQEETSPNKYKFRHRSEVFKGTRVEITAQLRTLKNNSKFVNIPDDIEKELNTLFLAAKKQAIPKHYKRYAIAFLDALYSYEDFAIIYENALYQVVKKVKKDMYVVDFKFERQFTKNKVALDRLIKEDVSNLEEFDRLKKEFTASQTKLLCHRWMKKKFEKYKDIDIVKNPDELMTAFKKTEAIHVYRLYNENKIEKIKTYLENQIIDFYYKKSLPEINPEVLDLQYITKI